MVVQYSVQDLSTSEGAEKLYARIRLAAQQVCPQVRPAELARYRVTLRCQNAAVDHAIS
ncbi:MAG: UrcA family protein [Steroidobacteraceae bacterium]